MAYRTEDSAIPAPVLKGIDAELEEGEFVALMGPSGSGKTTLLGILGAMSRPTEGRVLIDGIDIYSLSDERRADFRREYLGFVFQQHHLMPYLTAIENVMLPLVITKASSAQMKAKASEALRRVGLSAKEDRLPTQLSGGEQGRVAIARALVNEPPIILADEPTGSLDSKTGGEIIASLCSLKEQGLTILMVTHNPEAASVAGRILRLLDGLVVEEDFSIRAFTNAGHGATAPSAVNLSL